MAEAFKQQLNADVVRLMSGHLQRAAQAQSLAFDGERFCRLASEGLQELELKQRVQHIRRALHACLPDDFSAATGLIEAALVPVSQSANAWELRAEGDGICGWAVWPLTDFVAHHGLEQPQRALQSLHALTQRFTAEFAIRPFLLRWPELTLATLQQWLHDDSEHVRRLVSEGTRPRLPWGLRLHPFISQPHTCLPLLDRLHRDPSEYVRRSVANHLNDISKDHPQLAVQIAGRWLACGDAQTQRLVRHALRGLIKHGDAAALQLLGFGAHEQVSLQNLRLASAQIAAGGELQFSFDLHNDGSGTASLSVDYAIWHLRANGRLQPKVFKLARPQLAAGAHTTLSRRHSFRPVTTRRYYPGTHALEILINGQRFAYIEFQLGGTA